MSAWDGQAARIAARVRLMVARAVLALVNDATKLQAVQVQLQDGVTRDQAEHFQHYGFTSVPFPGAEGVALAVGGSTDHVVVVCIDDRRFRMKNLQPGEVALYTDEGDSIVFKRGRILEVTAGTRIDVLAPLVTFSGDVHVQGGLTANDGANIVGTLTATVDVIGGGKSLKTHTHGGVTAGGSSTGVPN